MAEVTQELVSELMKRMHADIGALKYGQAEIRTELNAIRGTMVSLQQDIHNIYGVLGQYENRIDRIETRLELRELSESQARFEPQP